MFSIFKRKGKTYQEQRANDFAYAKGAIPKGSKLSQRDKKMIAVGRSQVHLQESQAYKYNDAAKVKKSRTLRVSRGRARRRVPGIR